MPHSLLTHKKISHLLPETRHVRPTALKAHLLLVLTFGALLGGNAPTGAVEPAAIPTLEATQSGFHAVQQKIAPAVVTISSTTETAVTRSDTTAENQETPRGQQVRRVSGSGVVIRADGIVLTNSHVVQDATKLTVQFPNTEEKIPAEVVKTDPKTDLAIVRITQRGTYPTASLGDARTVQVGDWAIAFGTPYGLQSTMTVGIISAIGRKLDGPVGDFSYYDLLQTDAAINHGNSGGPLVNIRGEVIGINFMIFSPGDETGSIGIGFAIPINDYTRKIIETLTAGKAVERGRLGISIGEVSNAMRESSGVTSGGVVVKGVTPGQAGAAAGIKEDDIITVFNGQNVTDPDQFITLVERTQPGAHVPITVVRARRQLQLTIVMGSDAATGDNR